VQRPLTSGPKGWPAGQTPWPTDPTFQPLTDWLHRHALQEAVTRNPKLEVDGSRACCPPGQHLVCYRLNQIGNSSLDPYEYPSTGLVVDFKSV
jgi:hypothetical protein